MKRLINCLGKVVGKLVSKEDADALVREARALEAEGLNPIEAERRAVSDALQQVTENGENILRQIRAQRPEAHKQAFNFWDKETIRKAGMVPPPPAFVTEQAAPPTVEAPVSEKTSEERLARAPEAVEAPAPEPAPAPTEPAGPISDGAQEIVNNLPEEQQGAAQRAFAEDDTDPLADWQRRNGKPVDKRRGKPVPVEKNTKLVADASKYGAFDKTPSEVLRNIADDPSQPKWVRHIADLLHKFGLGNNVNIRMVNTPDASWRALYVDKGNGKGEVLINLSHTGTNFTQRLLHELVHHGTMAKIDAANSTLTEAQRAAKQELQKMFDSVRSRPEFKGLYGTTELREFVSEVFSNEEFRAKLAAIKDGNTSAFARILDAIKRVLFGKEGSGSLLDQAMRETLKVVGNEHVTEETPSEQEARQRREDAAWQANEHPNFQEEIANNVAPMANNMGITEADQIERELDHEAAFYSDEERSALEGDVDTMGKDIGATKEEIKSVKARLEAYIKYYRAKHPAKAGWANQAIKALGLDELKRGDANKANPSGITFKVKFQKTPYTFARDAANKLIPRFLKAKKGVPQADNPEWAKRRQELGDKMFDELSGIMERRNTGTEEERRVAQVILDQINWYRDMMSHLRTTFGSMSDYVADVIAGTSPITDVPGNWANMIEYFEGVMKGHYDKIYEEFDSYIAEDPENHTATTWRKKYPPEKFPEKFPKKLSNQKLFGANTANVMMAGLDMWRAVKSGTAPKARNFGLNLIGQSVRATIDRWAGRFLQRIHAPTWRLPPMIEGDVKGEHMPGENVELVSGDFGMGQDVFEDVAKRLQESDPEHFKDVTAADLQAILWFAEKEVWEIRKFTPIMGAGSSMNALAEATAAQRYEAGTVPGKVNAQDKALMKETIGLRSNINGEQHVLGAKLVPSVNVHEGEQSKTFDADWVTHPEYDPTNTIAHVAESAAKLGKDAAHISRVIVNRYEVNDHMVPGLHIFFKGRVGDAEVKDVLDKLKEAGITNGITLSVDPRVRPEIVKSLDPEAGANQYNGVRVQHIPGYGTAGETMSNTQLEKAITKARILLEDNANVAESRVLHYDTLVLRKGVDYDDTGKLTEDAKGGRAAWTERANREGTEAANRRDNIRKANADRKRADLELERRIEREEEERVAKWEAAQRSQDPASEGGVDPPRPAAMQYEDEREPTRDPHGGRASLVRSMVNRLTGASRNREGIEVPESEQEVRDPAGAGGRKNQGRKGSAPLWGSLGETFRRREASLYKGVESAATLIDAANPNEPDTKPEDSYRHSPTDYQNSQKLLDFLSGKEVPDDPELRDQITQLRKEIPTISSKEFEKHGHLDSGSEADVFHDTDNGVVYKIYNFRDGKMPQAYVPGQFRLDRGGDIRISMGDKPTVQDVLSRMERSNTHGLTPNELVAVTPEGQLVFAQPFVEGRGVSQKNMRAALARAGVHLLSEMGATSGVAKVGDRWVVYDDLHPGNVRTMPGGRVEIIDANSRELDPYEVDDLQTLGKLPEEGSRPAASREDVQDDTDLAVAPMAGYGERKRWPWPWQEKAEKVAGYEPGGMLSPQAQLSRPVGDILQEHKQEKGAIVTNMQYLAKALEKAMSGAYGKKPTDVQFKEVQTALGNIDNRLTQAQHQQALRISDPTRREAFIRAEHMNNVAAFKIKQQAALSNLPDAVRDAVIDMRQALDEQTQELLRDPGLDADLKARISTDQGVFLHSNSYQHFENDVWGKYVKSDDPEAQRIRRAAETLFKNEIVGELAHEYQVAHPGTSNADALRIASASAALPQMVKTRLADYLRKDADEITRIHMLTGKMPVAKSEGGKMLSLDRESIPKEIRELWGQWDEPKANFVKTYSLLAKHNADIRMQNRILAEGTAQGYIWKESTAITPRPDDLVPLGKAGDHGPLSDAYGPQLLKDGLSNYNHPAVQQLFTGLNRLALMMKTVGSVGSAVHNFFGNIGFTIANGNLPWLAVHFPKGILVTLAKGFQGLPKQSRRDEITELVRLGVFDSDLTLNETESIYKAVEVGAELEKKMGTAGGIYGAQAMLKRGARSVAGGFTNLYIAADNFWKYVNYKAELSKQQWFNENNPTPPSLEEMKQNAARMVQDTLPSRERVSEWVKRSVGPQSTAGQFVGPFFTFPLEAGRTVVNNAYHAGREMFAPGNSARERAFGAWRAAGMLGMISAPMLMSTLSKWLNHYTDDDEEALRAALPEYQKNSSLLWMKPRDENGAPQYYDLSYLNPYGYYHSAGIAGYRALRAGGSALQAAGKGLYAAGMNALTPLITVQPGIGTVMDIARNSDSLKGGAPIRNTEDTWANQSIDIVGRAIRGFAPGTAQNVYRTYLASQGYKDPKSGRPFELHRELESLVGAPHLETLERDKALASSVSNYKNRMGNAMRLLNDKIGAKGTVSPGAVAAAYEQANKQAFEIFSEMNKAYRNMLKLGMKSSAAKDAMEQGFGTEIRKGGLSKNKIEDITRGVFYPIEISDQMEKDVSLSFPDRYKEYRTVMKTKKKQVVEQ